MVHGRTAESGAQINLTKSEELLPTELAAKHVLSRSWCGVVHTARGEHAFHFALPDFKHGCDLLIDYQIQQCHMANILSTD